MKPFDISDPTLDVTRSCLLEASAGTGKTYTIEHLYARLLLERDPPTEVSRLLVVTFTKAATRELKLRIRKTLEGDPALKQAKVSFDEAQISTLHGFCYEMLKRYPLENELVVGEEEGVSEEEKLQVVRDYFRTGLGPFSQGQLDGVIRLARGDTDELAKLILREVERGGELVIPRPFDELALELRAPTLPSPDALLEAARCYKGVSNRQGELKEEVVEGIERFREDLERLSPQVLDSWLLQGNPFLEKVVRGELRAKQERPSLVESFESLAALLQEAGNPLNTLARMASDVKQKLAAQEKLSFDGILEAMERATRNGPFCQRVADAFDAAIVDEFQDTDPLQWTILQRLFKEKTLILVGDPKQSIYAFRNADIYAYLDALGFMGEEARFSLGTNYRSRPGLVAELNHLFSTKLIADPIPLPDREGAITCPPVQAGLSEDNALSKEGAVQFFVTSGKSSALGRFPTEEMETSAFLPFIGKEITTLTLTHHLPYSHFAILVHDRYQAKRVCDHLKEWGIEAITVRGTPPAEIPLFWPLYHVICAALHPENPTSLTTALASPLIGLLPHQWEGEAYTKLHRLGEILRERGFYPFFEKLIATEWGGRAPPQEHLEQLHELALQITDSREEDLIRLFHKLAERSDERFAVRDRKGADAVQVLTTFASKGLEFGVIFALSLATRSGRNGRGLIPFRRDGKTYLSGDGGTEGERLKMIAESDAEKMRLFYVALTRAKDRVYIPVALDSAGDPRPGTSSPIELYFSKLNPPISLTDVKRLDIGVLVREIEAGITPERALRDESEVHKEWLPCPSIPPKRLQSFSSLSSKHPPSLTFDQVGEFQRLPAGVDTGILVHELLEKIAPEAATSVEELLPMVISIVKGRLPGWEEVLSKMVLAAFNAPLTTFALQEVDPAKRLCEMDLLYTVDTLKGPVVPGMITGILDLFFEHEGKSYLLDWKTNRLPNYATATLLEEMERHDYFFQAKLYAEAANRYLNQLGHPPLAGCYYVFLRGLAANGEGVLLLQPEELTWN